MKRRFLVQDGQSALELIEEAFVLLRQLPWVSWLWYLAGALPLFVGVLYFWSDLSTSPFAEEHLLESSIIMVGLFFLAKTSQTVLADRIGCLARGVSPQPWTIRRWIHAMTLSLAIQSLGLFILPLAFILTLPAAWAIGFFQSATVLSAQPDLKLRECSASAWRLTRLWPVQNHTLLSILFLLGSIVFLNFLALSFALPQAARILLGVESTFTRSPWSTLNSTVLASVCGVTLLCLDPLIKAVYVLRHFYGNSAENGEDLLVSLREIRRFRGLGLSFFLLLSMLSSRLVAADAAPAPAPSVLNSQLLDAAIQKTLAKREYTWRLPKDLPKPEVAEASKEGFWDRFWSGIEGLLKRTAGLVGTIVDRIQAAVRSFFGPSPPPDRSRFVFDWLSPFRLLAVLVVGLLVGILAVAAQRLWRRYLLDRSAGSSALVPPAEVNLHDECVTASQLPHDRWVLLARELWAKGEVRLAMRAFYLANLAQLADRNLITLAAFKSNRDYLRDLARRAHAVPQVYGVFAEQVESFERVWYGTHAADEQALTAFAARTEDVRQALR